MRSGWLEVPESGRTVSLAVERGQGAIMPGSHTPVAEPPTKATAFCNNAVFLVSFRSAKEDVAPANKELNKSCAENAKKCGKMFAF
jgi:hypothetical protein